MKKIFIIFLIVLDVFIGQLYSQELININNDSLEITNLKKILQKGINNNNLDQTIFYYNVLRNLIARKSDSINIEHGAESHLKVAKAYKNNGRYEDAFKLYLESINDYQILNNKSKLFLIYNEVGSLLQEWGALDKALFYFDQALAIYSNKSMDSQLSTLLRVSEVYVTLEKYNEAIHQYEAILKYYKKLNLTKPRIKILKKISSIYITLNQYQKALDYELLAREQANILNDSISIIRSFNDIAYIYTKIDKLFPAKTFLINSLKKTEHYSSSKNIINIKLSILINLAIIYQNLSEYNECFSYLNRALIIATNHNNKKELIDIYNIYTKLYIILNDVIQARKFSDLCTDLAEREDYMAGTALSYKLKHELYIKQGDSKEALRAYQKYITLNSQIINKKSKLESNRLELVSLIDRIEQSQALEFESKRNQKLERKLEKENEEKEKKLLTKEKELLEEKLQHDRLQKVQAERELIIIQERYQNAQKERQIEKLQKEKQIQDIRSSAKKKEEERRKQDLIRIKKEKELAEKNRLQQIESQKTQEKYFVIGFILLVLILTLILGFLYTKQKDNKKLAKTNHQLESQTNEIHYQNEELQKREKQLQKNATKLENINSELQTTLNNLKSTQSQLIQAERMASLGQLIAGVAHEVNTPLGAINASISNISDALKHSTNMMPKLFKILNDNDLVLFQELLQLSFISKTILSSKEERMLRRTLTRLLTDIPNLNDKERDLASMLVDIGNTIEDPDAFIQQFRRLFEHSEVMYIIQLAYYLAVQQKSSNNIQLAVKKASKVVFALKSYSHQGSNSGKPIETNIIENIETVLTIYHNILKQGVEVNKHYDTEVPTIYCYPDELSQVWTNLLTNAVQAMNNTGVIDLSVQKKDDKHVVIKLSDAGSGIPKDIIERIFEPFFTTKKAGEGTGLGLDIVKKIIDKHQGNIKVESKVGKGTTFTVILPIETNENMSI